MQMVLVDLWRDISFSLEDVPNDVDAIPLMITDAPPHYETSAASWIRVRFLRLGVTDMKILEEWGKPRTVFALDYKEAR